MLSKAKVRFIKSLQVKKYRQAEQCFLVQGAKAVRETLASDHEVTILAGTADFIRDVSRLSEKAAETIIVSESELTNIGSLEENTAALAVVRMKPYRKPELSNSDFALVLDSIRDPGNLGTIIRTADWYGIKNIIASMDTTELYSPKVINATMGSFLRVKVFYTSLDVFLPSIKLQSYGTFLDGIDIHKVKPINGGLIVIGNESRGISPTVEKLIAHRITIPRYGKAESLNAGVATAIVLDVFTAKAQGR